MKVQMTCPICQNETFIDLGKGRYDDTREEAAEHEGRAEAARQHVTTQDAFAAASQYDPRYNYGYQPGYPWH